MAIINPFRGIRYNSEKVGALQTVVAPPYDVISPEGRAQLLSKNLFNVVRIDLPIGDGDAKYRYAGSLWRRWRESGVLVRDPAPALYFLEERYVTPSGRPSARRGFIGELVLEKIGKGSVLPHERTFAGPKADRLRLMEETLANLSPVFLLYRDPMDELGETYSRTASYPPDVEVETPDGTSRMWRVTDGDDIRRVAEVVRRYPLIIADGHHRYETAIRFRDQQRSMGIRGAAESLMVYLCSSDDPDLTILPPHRVVTFPPSFDMDGFVSRLETYFTVTAVDATSPNLRGLLGKSAGEPYEIGMWVKNRGSFVLQLRSWERVAEWIDPQRSLAWRKLDVSLLHEVVLKRIAGVSENDMNIRYTVDPEDGCSAVVSGSADIFFLIRAPSAAQIAEVAEAGDVMPHKSTYFSPKPLTGMVMRSLSD
ncbi:MAG TPA: DUF1015 domain-containing protein [Candidatus Latescibacteria bacterium]|nr:DUF1015 domain-containing protein [Candidatus Latescibacterota bacterium]HPC45397.1 DUF1015 domain-containing protein [Candidatus Latescibacterota bacterium]HQK22484.1 DUF1015 domain-containing protein [Candidatus Latescibacterota bacterium]